MKKISLLIVLLLCIPACCFATEITLENGTAEQILQQGNTIHIVFHEYNEDGQSQMVCRVLTEDNGMIPCDGQCPSLWKETVDEEGKTHHELPAYRTACASEEGSFYLDNDGHLLQWMPEENGIWKQRCTLDLDGTDVDLADQEAEISFRYINGTFYLGYTKDNQGTLYAFSPEDGSRTMIYRAVHMGEIYSDYGDEILIRTGPKFQHLNLNDKKTRLFTIGLKDAWMDLRPDGKGDYLYLGYSGLHHVDQELKEETIYQLPHGTVPLSALYYRPSTQDYLFMSYVQEGESRIALHIVKAAPEQKNDLNLVDNANELSGMSAYVPRMDDFYATHEQFLVNQVTTIADYDQLNQQLMLGGDSFDVVLVDAQVFDLSSIYRKGYYVDLSDEEEIASYIASAYPAFREACMAGEQIAALPLVARESILMVNEPLWEELGLSIPATYGELLDTITHCLEEGILNEHPLFQSNRYELDSRGQVISWDMMAPTESYNTLWDHLLQSYVGTSQRKGELTFQDDTIMALMAQLRGMKDKLDEHDARRVVGDALLFPYGQLTYVTGDKFYDQESFRPLLLGVHDAEDIVVPVRLKVMLINPHSPRVDLAKEYLAYFAAHPTSTTRCVITTEQPDGIEKPGSFATKESDASFEAEMLSRIEEAKAEADLITVRDLEDQLAKFKESRFVNWDVMPESAQAYYQVTPYLVAMDSENLGFVEENGNRDIAAFNEGRIDAKTLCQRLEQLLMMRRMENQ